MKLGWLIMGHPLVRGSLAAIFILFGIGSAALHMAVGGSAQLLEVVEILAVASALMMAIPPRKLGDGWFHILPALIIPEAGLGVIAVAPNGAAVMTVFVLMGVLVGFLMDTPKWVAIHMAFAVVVLAAAAVIGGSTLLTFTTGGISAAVMISLSVFVYVFWGYAEVQAEELARLGQRDPLTGIANRRVLDERLEYELARHSRAGRELSVIVFDLNGFKDINDMLGHAAGDDVLRDAAKALSSAVRAQDTVARQGGDEFCVLAPETSRAEAEALVLQIRIALSGVDAAGRPLASAIGVATFPADGKDASRLTEVADARQRADKPVPHAVETGRFPSALAS